ncbi:hypothetical protein NX029_26420 [Cytobacillus firmus]|nr:hypothetical protein [Cytobacillus firmus]
MAVLKKVLTRLKNPKVAIAVASGILLILVNFGVIDVALSEKIMDAVNTLLTIGVAVGIFANPESHISEK